MTKVMEEMVFTMEVTNVGDVYFRLAKYMFRVKLTLHDEAHDALKMSSLSRWHFRASFFSFRFLSSLLKRWKKGDSFSYLILFLPEKRQHKDLHEQLECHFGPQPPARKRPRRGSESTSKKVQISEL